MSVPNKYLVEVATETQSLDSECIQYRGLMNQKGLSADGRELSWCLYQKVATSSLWECRCCIIL